jgi:hypothetical protein
VPFCDKEFHANLILEGIHYIPLQQMTYPNVSQISIDGSMKKELNKDNDDDVPAITLLFYIFC